MVFVLSFGLDLSRLGKRCAVMSDGGALRLRKLDDRVRHCSATKMQLLNRLIFFSVFFSSSRCAKTSVDRGSRCAAPRGEVDNLGVNLGSQRLLYY